MSDARIILNGRAASRSTITGVERWATETIPRLLALRPDRYRIIAPPRGLAHRAGQAWEQLVLPARAARRRADLIFSPANLAPWLWPRNVVVVHDAAVLRNPGDFSHLYRRWHAHLGLTSARRALLVVTVSEFSRRELVTLGELDPDRVVVVHGGVDAHFTPAVDWAPAASRLGLTRPYVLTVGTADRRKNLRVLDETARRLDRLGMDLVWAGGSRSHLQAQLPPTCLRALGYVAEDDLPSLYAGARAFVLPSLYEGFGLPCLEAMACGTPVVASDRSALPEVCADAAILVNAEDPAVVAEAVTRAVTDERLRGHLRGRGLERAAGLSWDRTARRLDDLLSTLVSAA